MLAVNEWQLVQPLAFGSLAMAGVIVSDCRECGLESGAGEKADV